MSFALGLYGTPGDAGFEGAAESLEKEAERVHQDDLAVVFARPKPDVCVVRLVSQTLHAADDAIRGLNGTVAESLLNFNPVTRKA